MEAADPRPRSADADAGPAPLPAPAATMAAPPLQPPAATAVVTIAEALPPPTTDPTRLVPLNDDPRPTPMFATERSGETPGHRRAPVVLPARLPMWPFRVLAIAGVALAFVLYGWQVFRVVDDQERLPVLEWAPLLVGLVGAIGVVLWTYVVVENARRVYLPARVSEPPQPGHAASTWIPPVAFAAVAAVSISALSRRFDTPVDGAESSLPLILAIAAILLAFPVMYGPVSHLSGVVRKVGGKGIRLGEWLLVPVVLAGVGAAMIFGLRAGVTGSDTTDGFAPAWMVGVAAIVPATVVVLLGWRAAQTVENDIVRAFDRRSGTNSSFTSRRGKLAALFADDGPNHMALRNTGHIRQFPGGNPIGTVIIATLAGLALLSVIGAIVMYLFWREGTDGVLLASQSDRAWKVLTSLQDAQRTLAFVALGVATVWTALTVTNVRLASARHRNPVLAALSWPAAAAGIWMVGDRLVAGGSAQEVVLGFAAQAALLCVPFLVLERSAQAVGARRNPLRIAAAVGVVLLIQIQGLGGLATLTPSTEQSELGPLVGYLALGALVQLLSTLSVIDATRSLTAMTEHVVEAHNELVEQRVEHGVHPLAVAPALVPERA